MSNTSRQRLRRNSSSSNDEKLLGLFSKTCHNSLNTLMQHHGYSRERAISTLLAEITISTTEDDASDQEIFGVMQRHGLGWEQARNACRVAKSVQTGNSIRAMTTKVANIQPHDCHRTQVQVSDTTATSSTPLRILPVQPSSSSSSLKEPATVAVASRSSNKNNTVSSKKSKAAASSKNNKTTTTTGVEANSQQRPRSNSMEAVTAKLALPPRTNNKRSRSVVDDASNGGEQQQPQPVASPPAAKRSRKNSSGSITKQLA